MGRCSDARDRLLDTAARLIHERGYSAVSVSDICTDAGLKKGSFYHFFPSKRDLVLATIDEYAARQKEAVRGVIQGAGTARERLRRMFAATATGLQQCHEANGAIRGCPVGNLALEMAHRDDAIRDKVSDIFTAWREAIEQMLRKAQDDGELELTDPSSTSEALIAFIEGAILMAKATNDPGVFARLAAGAEAIVDGASTPA